MSAPLEGRRIVVTRPDHQAGSFVDRLAALGAQVIRFPTIAVVPPSDGGKALAEAAARIEVYDWVVLTSTNGVDALAAAIGDPARLDRCALAAIGPATAAASIERFGRAPDLVPPRFVAESLLEVFPKPTGSCRLALIARAEVARPVLPDGLAKMGWEVDLVASYLIEATRPAAADVDRLAGADVVTFTSPSTFVQFLELAGRSRLAPTVACIGPVTAEAVRSHGVSVAVEAPVHTTEGLVEALVAAIGHERPTPRHGGA